MKALTFAVLTSLLAAGSASAEVRVTMNDGRVTIAAKDATVRQILQEWARVGQTKIVNVERIPGGPVSIELNNVPEGQALDMLLRSVSGYMAAPRATLAANLSMFDRVIVMPTSAAPRPPVSAQAPAPTFQQPPQFAPPQPTADDDADEPPAPNVPGPRGPVFTQPPAPQVVNPQQNPQSGFTSRPGQIAPVPQPQPGTEAPPAPFRSPSEGGNPTPAGGTAPPGTTGRPGQIQPPVQPQMPGQTPARRPGGPGGDRE